jgi:hypothetical protein
LLAHKKARLIEE